MEQPWQEALASGDVVLCNMAITSLGRQSHWKQAVDFLEKIIEDELQPTVVTFASCLAACARGTEFQGVRQILQHAQQAIQLNLVIYNIAINACEKVSEWQQSLVWLQAAKAERLRPDVVTVTAVAGSCLEGQWQLGSWLLDEMTIKHLLPDLIAQHTSMRSMRASHASGSSSGDWSNCLWQLKWMMERSFQPDILTYNVVQLACYEGSWPRSLQVFSETMRVCTQSDSGG